MIRCRTLTDTKHSSGSMHRHKRDGEHTGTQSHIRFLEKKYETLCMLLGLIRYTRRRLNELRRGISICLVKEC